MSATGFLVRQLKCLFVIFSYDLSDESYEFDSFLNVLNSIFFWSFGPRKKEKEHTKIVITDAMKKTRKDSFFPDKIQKIKKRKIRVQI